MVLSTAAVIANEVNFNVASSDFIAGYHHDPCYTVEPVYGLDHGRQVHAPRVLGWFEKRLDSGPQNWKQYTAALLIFNAVLFVFGFIALACSRSRR